jgi:adenylate cyclase
MGTANVKRKLAAILSADVEGYSRLMSEDEVGTIRTVNKYKEAMTALIRQYSGRVVDAPGDNLLAEFASVVDAVNCAVEIQRELADRNDALPVKQQMHFRMGVNLGDIVEEEDQIYGDGVNIASRVESLCDAGGVCISGTAFEHIENKLDLKFKDLGEHKVKNIVKPVRVYSIILTAESHEPVIEEKLELPDKPSIAVLPFVNMSGDPEQEYFSDGITEDITTDLSKMSGLFVISRSSTFTYKGKPVKIKQVAEELGVRYVLEGSVRKGSDKIRINAQLIDATTGHHLWAERYDRDLKDIFALQDEITQKIVLTLRIEVEEAELDRIRRVPTANLNAYESALRGTGLFQSYKKSTNVQARQMFERAIELDPEYARPYVGLGFTYLFDWLWFWTHDPQALERAVELAQKAIELDDFDAYAYMLSGMVYLWKDRQHEQAIAAAQKAIDLDPNNVWGYGFLAEILNFAGRPEEVTGLMEKAMRLNPRYPADYLFQSGRAHYYMGQYNKSIEIMKRVVTRKPDLMPPHLYLAASYVQLDREEDARAEVAEVLRISPDVRIGDRRLPYKDQAVKEGVIEGLRRAGLK